MISLQPSLCESSSVPVFILQSCDLLNIFPESLVTFTLLVFVGKFSCIYCKTDLLFSTLGMGKLAGFLLLNRVQNIIQAVWCLLCTTQLISIVGVFICIYEVHDTM